MGVEVGQEAPDFTLTSGDGEAVTLSSFRGRTSVVLIFYPLAFSSVCTRQLSAVGALEGRSAEEGAQVLAVSVDSRHAQAAFVRSLDLDATTLLADFEPKGEVARRYGVYNPERGHSKRAWFVIDRDGIVRHAEVVAPREIPDQEGYFAALATCET